MLYFLSKAIPTKSTGIHTKNNNNSKEIFKLLIKYWA